MTIPRSPGTQNISLCQQMAPFWISLVGENRHAYIAWSVFLFSINMMYPCLIFCDNYLKKNGWIRLKASQNCSSMFRVWFGLVSAFGLSIWQTVCSSRRFLSKQYEQTCHLCYVFETPIIHHHLMNPFDLGINGFWAPFPCVIVRSLPVPLKISNPLLHGRKAERINRRVLTISSWISLVFIPFLWRNLITALDSFLSIFQCCSYWVKCSVICIQKH